MDVCDSLAKFCWTGAAAGAAPVDVREKLIDILVGKFAAVGTVGASFVLSCLRRIQEEWYYMYLDKDCRLLVAAAVEDRKQMNHGSHTGRNTLQLQVAAVEEDENLGVNLNEAEEVVVVVEEEGGESPDLGVVFPASYLDMS